jgi:hypothetical protein
MMLKIWFYSRPYRFCMPYPPCCNMWPPPVVASATYVSPDIADQLRHVITQYAFFWSHYTIAAWCLWWLDPPAGPCLSSMNNYNQGSHTSAHKHVDFVHDKMANFAWRFGPSWQSQGPTQTPCVPLWLHYLMQTLALSYFWPLILWRQCKLCQAYTTHSQPCNLGMPWTSSYIVCKHQPLIQTSQCIWTKSTLAMASIKFGSRLTFDAQSLQSYCPSCACTGEEATLRAIYSFNHPNGVRKKSIGVYWIPTCSCWSTTKLLLGWMIDTV